MSDVLSSQMVISTYLARSRLESCLGERRAPPSTPRRVRPDSLSPRTFAFADPHSRSRLAKGYFERDSCRKVSERKANDLRDATRHHKPRELREKSERCVDERKLQTYPSEIIGSDERRTRL